MELSEQVVSLELAKKLKELGVEQDSLFEYRKFDDGKDFFWSKPIFVGKIPDKLGCANVGFGKVSAFTVAELGEILWDVFEKTDWKLLYKAYGEVFDFKGTSWIGDLGIVNLIRNPNMSAKMLIYLLEKNLIINEAK